VKFIKFAPLELPDSRILRLNRLYPGTQIRATVRTIQVPAPLTSLVNGQVLKNQELLTWITKLLHEVFEDELKGSTP
jgi:transcription-repair coupling factor (superfamily II helicase)